MLKKVVTFGEVMMRLSAPGVQRFTQANSFDITYAGAEANVAVCVKQLGIPSAHVTRFPKNDLGLAAAQSLQKLGVDTSKIQYGDERLGLYFLENGAVHRAPKIVYDRFDSAFAHIKKNDIDWAEILREASWFHYTGITPAISQGAADSCIDAVRTAKKLGITVSGDINYRRNLWRYGKAAHEIMPALIERTDLVVAGRGDMENCAQITGDNWQDACAKLMREFPNVKRVVKTDRESINASHNDIRAVSFDGRELYKSRKYEITNIVDRVGSGDAFIGGMIAALLLGKNAEDALEIATASCAWKHTIPGDHNLISWDELEQLVNGENVGKLLR